MNVSSLRVRLDTVIAEMASLAQFLESLKKDVADLPFAERMTTPPLTRSAQMIVETSKMGR